MPRITAHDYLIRREILKRIWLQDPGLVTGLDSAKQRDLQEYFRPNEEGMDDELLTYRLLVTGEDLSLPHRASRAFLSLLRQPQSIAAAASSTLPSESNPARSTISNASGVRPGSDIARLVDVLLQLVENLPSEELQRLAAMSRNSRERRPHER